MAAGTRATRNRDASSFNTGSVSGRAGFRAGGGIYGATADKSKGSCRTNARPPQAGAVPNVNGDHMLRWAGNFTVQAMRTDLEGNMCYT